jgi:ubiquinone/menaquinone biosynthesis C-methylase UbiE
MINKGSYKYMDLKVGAWRISIEKTLPQAPELAKIYDSTKWYWNSLIHRLNFGRAYRRLFKRVLKDWHLVNLQNGSKVLDVGIGAGLFTESLIRTIKYNYKIFGIDISEQLLDRARQNLAPYQAEVQLEKGDVRHLPFGTGEMDLVISGLALEHALDPAAAIGEMTRVLGSGSNILLVVTLPYAPDFITRLFYHYTPLPQKQLKKWMEDAGLTNIRTYNLTGPARIFGRAFVGKKI